MMSLVRIETNDPSVAQIMNESDKFRRFAATLLASLTHAIFHFTNNYRWTTVSLLLIASREKCYFRNEWRTSYNKRTSYNELKNIASMNAQVACRLLQDLKLFRLTATTIESFKVSPKEGCRNQTPMLVERSSYWLD